MPREPISAPINHDRENEPAGGYVHAEDRGDSPEGYREVPADEQHGPAAEERDPIEAPA